MLSFIDFQDFRERGIDLPTETKLYRNEGCKVSPGVRFKGFIGVHGLLILSVTTVRGIERSALEQRAHLALRALFQGRVTERLKVDLRASLTATECGAILPPCDYFFSLSCF